MKKLVVLLMVSLMAASAFAGLDDGTNSMGIYFDLAATNNSATMAPFVATPVYVILANCPLATIDGFEFGYKAVAAAGTYQRLSETLPVGGLNVGQTADGANGFYVVGLASPKVTSSATVMVTWSAMVFNTTPVQFYLGPTPVPGIPGVPAIVLNGTLYPCYIASGSKDLPVASINGESVVAVEETSFGSLKSLFR